VVTRCPEKEADVAEKQAPVFGRPKDWNKMTPEQRREWALGLLRAATETSEAVSPKATRNARPS
jgi:hypothetical protein